MRKSKEELIVLFRAFFMALGKEERGFVEAEALAGVTFSIWIGAWLQV